LFQLQFDTITSLRAKAATAFSESWPSQFCLSIRPSFVKTAGDRLTVCEHELL